MAGPFFTAARRSLIFLLIAFTSLTYLAATAGEGTAVAKLNVTSDTVVRTCVPRYVCARSRD